MRKARASNLWVRLRVEHALAQLFFGEKAEHVSPVHFCGLHFNDKRWRIAVFTKIDGLVILDVAKETNSVSVKTDLFEVLLTVLKRTLLYPILTISPIEMVRAVRNL